MKQSKLYEKEHHYGTDKRKMNTKEFYAHSFNERFAIRLNALRLSKKISQAELAKAIGVNRTTLSNYETSRRVPDIEICCKIANYFGISIETFVGHLIKSNMQDYIDYFSPKIRTKLRALINEPRHKNTVGLMVKDTDFTALLNMIYSYCTFSSKVDEAHRNAITEQDRVAIFTKEFADYYLPYTDIGKKNSCDWFRCAAHMFLDNMIDNISKSSYYKNEMHSKIEEYLSEKNGE